MPTRNEKVVIKAVKQRIEARQEEIRSLVKLQEVDRKWLDELGGNDD